MDFLEPPFGYNAKSSQGLKTISGHGSGGACSGIIGNMLELESQTDSHCVIV